MIRSLVFLVELIELFKVHYKGPVASLLLRLSPDRVVRFGALAGDRILCIFVKTHNSRSAAFYPGVLVYQ